ncbi:hypothetical protein [Microvirga lotononidis]|uniref:Nitrate reductase n=1 Tax=Microvirga lotononidis TaxID=864069 RepID=I4YTJ9_9HYPH|nr:hypothetical protein [Microvirga lotononidis]EIM27291.1 hypothetical protein MicloDRAFT_00038500 [Microvirga lotononidis]WQO28536.1 hypothetical protein U0023_05485 [Microvirga lotononidis]
MVRLGAFLRGTFGLPKPDKQAVDRVKDLARSALETAPDTAFAVNEIACNDPGCPGIETVILVMEPGRKTRALKIAKSLDDVMEQDIIGALDP